MKTTYSCTITVHSPLHIGCDEVYEPMGFVLDEAGSELIHFEPAQFISTLSLSDRQNLSEICRRADLPSILQLYKFFQGKDAQGRRVKVSAQFVKHYRQTLNLPEKLIQQNLNRFVIERTAFRLADDRPFLPGSSIKGALRTGYLNHVCQGKNMRIRDGKKLEGTLLDYSYIDQDPFGRVKVSDFQPVGEIQTRIVYAVNKKKKPSDREARGPYQILEVVEPGSVFAGEITVLDTEVKSPVKHRVKLDDLLSGSNTFYTGEYRRETAELAGAGIHHDNMSPKGTSLIRAGRHSGAESVTIKGNRDIKIMLGGRNNAFKPYATTLWLASPERQPGNNDDLLPFGWLSVAHIDPEQQSKLTVREEDYLRQKECQEKDRLKAVQVQKEKEEAALKEEEEKQKIEAQKAQEEARRKEALEEMSPEDRELAEIFDSGPVVENNVVDLYNRLDEMPPDFKAKCAGKIKSYYQSAGKWKVNKKKAKQFEKVKHLKSILGES